MSVVLVCEIGDRAGHTVHKLVVNAAPQLFKIA